MLHGRLPERDLKNLQLIIFRSAAKNNQSIIIWARERVAEETATGNLGLS